MRHWIFENLELLVGLIGILVIVAVPFLVNPPDLLWWKYAALTLIGVGVVYCMLFWLIHRRQRLVRKQAIREIRLMLKDVVNNQLSSIKLNTYLAGRSGLNEKHIERITLSIEAISQAVEKLSAESLRDWKIKYNLPDIQDEEVGKTA